MDENSLMPIDNSKSKVHQRSSNESAKMLSLLDCDKHLLEFDESSQIAQFYAHKCVFITGASGFVGKVLVEKLLRSCQHVGRIYILMRAKNGRSPVQRLADLTQSEIFARLKQSLGYERALKLFDEKLHVVAGDITQHNFGLSLESINELCENVSIVIHSAATVKFNEPLKIAIENNLVSMQNLLSLARCLRKLTALVHVSTAYSNCDREIVAEQLYAPPLAPNRLIEMAQWMDNELLDKLTDSLIGKRPNTYTYTKACAEALLAESALTDLKNVPIAIIRPSIVTGCWREPVRGWVDNMNGPTGVVLAAMTGAIQTMLVDPSMNGDLIPVDIVANLIICSAWQISKTQLAISNSKSTTETTTKCLIKTQHEDREEEEGNVSTQTKHFNSSTSTATTTTTTIATTTQPTTTITTTTTQNSNITNISNKQQQQTPSSHLLKTPANVTIFNCVSGAANPISWRKFANVIYKVGYIYPCNRILRCPRKLLIASPRVYATVDFFNHKLVYYLADFACKLVGKKQHLVKLYGRLERMVLTLKPFVLNQWQFESTNVVCLNQQLSNLDKQIFNFNVADVDWEDYILRYYVGCKLFVLKDDPRAIDSAQIKLKSALRGAKLLTLLLAMLAYYFVMFGSSVESSLLVFIEQILTFVLSSTASILPLSASTSASTSMSHSTMLTQVATSGDVNSTALVTHERSTGLICAALTEVASQGAFL